MKSRRICVSPPPQDVNMHKTSRKAPVKPQPDLNLSQTSPSPTSILACRFEMGNVTKISLNPLVTFLLPFPDDYRLKILRQHSDKGQYTFITGCTSQAKLSVRNFTDEVFMILLP